MIKKNAHHIIGGVPELCRTDPAYSAVIHLCSHGGAELLIDRIEEYILKAGGQIGEGIPVRRKVPQERGSLLPDSGTVHQGRPEAETQGFPNMPGFDHAHPSVIVSLYNVYCMIS